MERFNLSDFKEGKYPIESDIYCKKILQSSKTENFHEEKLKSSIFKLKKVSKKEKIYECPSSLSPPDLEC